MNNITFQKDGDYTVCLMNGKEISRAKVSSTGGGITPEQVAAIVDEELSNNLKTIYNIPIKGTGDLVNVIVISDNRLIPSEDGSFHFTFTEEEYASITPLTVIKLGDYYFKNVYYDEKDWLSTNVVQMVSRVKDVECGTMIINHSTRECVVNLYTLTATQE